MLRPGNRDFDVLVAHEPCLIQRRGDVDAEIQQAVVELVEVGAFGFHHRGVVLRQLGRQEETECPDCQGFVEAGLGELAQRGQAAGSGYRAGLLWPRRSRRRRNSDGLAPAYNAGLHCPAIHP